MSSFFSLSSTSSSTNPTPTMQDYVRNMHAVPAALARSGRATALTATSHRRRGRRINANEVLSRYFNTVANRPLSYIRIPNQEYVANLTLRNSAVLTTSTTLPTYAANAFSINDFGNQSQYLGCFDQYKFVEAEIWIEPILSQSTAVANVGALYTAVDVDDASTPLTIDSVSGKQNSLQSSCLDGHYHHWVPHMAVAAYSGVFTSFSNMPPQWIDSASPTVQHYGVKYAAGVTSVAITFQITIKAKIAFRQAGI